MVDVGKEVMIVVEGPTKSSSARSVVAAAEGRPEIMVGLEGRVKRIREAHSLRLSP